MTLRRGLAPFLALMLLAALGAPSRAGAQAQRHAETACPSGESHCAGGCVNLASDPRHCGSCGHHCLAGESCVSGMCSGCSVGQVACPKGCASLSSDPANCGQCGHRCGAGQSCSNGACSSR